MRISTKLRLLQRGSAPQRFCKESRYSQQDIRSAIVGGKYTAINCAKHLKTKNIKGNPDLLLKEN